MRILSLFTSSIIQHHQKVAVLTLLFLLCFLLLNINLECHFAVKLCHSPFFRKASLVLSPCQVQNGHTVGFVVVVVVKDEVFGCEEQGKSKNFCADLPSTFIEEKITIWF